jgi:hypothetical protein
MPWLTRYSVPSGIATARLGPMVAKILCPE